MNAAQFTVIIMCLPAAIGGTWRCVQSWRGARRLLNAEDQALAVANSGATHKLPAAVPAACPRTAHRPPQRPAGPPPGLTAAEKGMAAYLAAQLWSPQARANGRDYADQLRLLAPTLSDTQLARLALFAAHSARQVAQALPGPEWALRYLLDQLATAALELAGTGQMETTGGVSTGD